jgi:putative acetyltransferase
MADVVTVVRHEAPHDHAAVHELNCVAFSGEIEATLVDKLRGSSGCISLVAAEAGRIVGHILCTPVKIDGPASGVRTAGLGPMAVVPERQRCGIGSRLAQHCLEECHRTGYQAVVVVGHPEYYPRFGFRRASGFGLRCQFDVPDDVFMALELEPGVLAQGGGEVKYAAEFSEG